MSHLRSITIYSFLFVMCTDVSKPINALKDLQPFRTHVTYGRHFFLCPVSRTIKSGQWTALCPQAGTHAATHTGPDVTSRYQNSLVECTRTKGHIFNRPNSIVI